MYTNEWIEILLCSTVVVHVLSVPGSVWAVASGRVRGINWLPPVLTRIFGAKKIIKYRIPQAIEEKRSERSANTELCEV